jgi:ATP-binding cassette subfamily C (CFTR/MRP) protein 1
VGDCLLKYLESHKGPQILGVGGVTMSMAHSSIGYCDQSPYLMSASIRENIVGFSQINTERYDSVIQATLLYIDLVALPEGDSTNTNVLSGGQRQRVAMARALYLESELVIFDDTLNGLDADTEERVFQHVLGSDGLISRRGATAILCTHHVRYLSHAHHIIVLGSDGTVVQQGSFEHLVKNESYVALLRTGMDNDNNNDNKISSTYNDAVRELAPQFPTDPLSRGAAQVVSRISADELARRTGDIAVYKHYFGTIAILPTVCFLLSGVCWGFFNNFPQVWLSMASKDLQTRTHSRAYWIGIYGIFQVAALASLTIATVVVVTTIVRLSGLELHRRAVRTLMTAPLRFLTTTDVGTITNLFSQDITLVDGELPIAMLNLTLMVFQVIGMAAVIAIASPWLILAYPGLVIVMYVIQLFYLRTSRQLRLLDLEAKSPLYSDFLYASKAAPTIRALGWINPHMEHSNDLLDASQRPAYLLAMIQRWLLLTLNLVVMCFAVIIVVLATQLRASSQGFVGATLVTLMSFGLTLSNIVRYWTSTETAIGAVARLKSFEQTESESLPNNNLKPANNWPQKGAIQISNVSAHYG